MPDEHGYPVEEELEKIRQWNTTKENWHDFMEYIKSVWWMPDWGWSRDGDIYHISTGGWSGNEDIVAAMQENHMFWIMYWHSSRRGGHYVFAPSGTDVE